MITDNSYAIYRLVYTGLKLPHACSRTFRTALFQWRTLSRDHVQRAGQYLQLLNCDAFIRVRAHLCGYILNAPNGQSIH
jgi:hypothetical protein